MNLAEYLSPDRVLFSAGKTKAEVIEELIDAAVASKRVPDRDSLRKAVLHREGLMSTGIGLGIGVPHVRLDDVSEPCISVGVHKKGIADYESLDGEPVHIVVLIVAGKAQHALYIRLLSTVTSLLKVPEIRDRLIGAKKPDEIYEALTEAEGG